MAPKVKKDKISDEAVQEICLEYMVSQNRPYNATDVALNCHEQFTKAAAQKALQALADREAITCKNLAKDGKGSTLVFCARQDQEQALDAEGLAKLAAELERLRSEVAAAKEKNKSLFHEVSTLQACRSTEQLEAELTTLNEQQYESGSRKMHTAQEVAEIDKQYDYFRKAHKKHKKEFQDIFATLCEGMDKTKKESIVWREELGIDEVEEDPEYQWKEDPLAQVFKRAKTSGSGSYGDKSIHT